MPCLGTWNTRKIFWKIEILTCFENMTANIYAFLSFSLSGLATWQGIFISICYPKRLSMTHHMIETTTNIIWNLLRSHLGSSPNPDTSNLTRRNSLDAIRSFLLLLDFLFILGSTRYVANSSEGQSGLYSVKVEVLFNSMKALLVSSSDSYLELLLIWQTQPIYK